MGAKRTLELLCCIGLLCLIFNTDIVAHAQTHTKRATSARVTSSRSSFGTNVKHSSSSSSNSLNFDCPEEFGYYPHPTDCSQYYVCVFGGALLESCTGGLMYSHELQTCDWPRNVGCEVVDSGSSASNTNGQREGSGRSIKQQSVPNQHVPSRVRFGSAFTNPAPTSSTTSSHQYEQPKPTVPQQYHRQPSQTIQAQVQTLAQPPELKVPHNPVITSRGQTKALLDSQEDIAKLYADAHDTLPPVEEEETDRQQRVYRGQPSTVSQVQRDRDGIIHQASLNAIPNHGKIGSFAFGSHYSKNFLDPKTLDKTDFRLNRRGKRDLSETTTSKSILMPQSSSTKIVNFTEESATAKEYLSVIRDSTSQNESATEKVLKESKMENINETIHTNGEFTPRTHSNTSSEIIDEAPPIDTAENDSSTAKEFLDLEGIDPNDALPSESLRSPRQLRAYGRSRARWPSHVQTKFRSIESNPYHQQQSGYVIGSYNPYLSAPANSNYNQLSPGYQPYQTIKQPSAQSIFTRYNVNIPPSQIEDDFRPIAGSYYSSGTTSTTARPSYLQNSDLLPYLLQSLKEYKEHKKQQQQTGSFSYFHLENQPVSTTSKPIQHHYQSQQQQHQFYQPQSLKSQAAPQHSESQKVIPNSHYAGYSTVGGFYNNQANSRYKANTESSIQLEFKPTVNAAKLVSHYSIIDSHLPSTTTERNYFQSNILTNQKTKAFYNPVYKNSHHTTPSPPTSNINIVAAPNLATTRSPLVSSVSNKGIVYANSSVQQDFYDDFTPSLPAISQKLKPVSTTIPFLKPQINLQFDIPQFVANLQASDLANMNPAVTDMLKYFKQLGAVRQQSSFQRPQNSFPTTDNADEDYEDEILESTTERSRLRNKIPTTIPTTTSTRRPLKGYESFIKSIPNQYETTPGTTNKFLSHNSFLNQGEEYYDEYDEDDGTDSDDEIQPPSEMPPYMPMSETMSPPRQHFTTSSPPTTTKNFNYKPSYITGYFEATTTRRPFFGAVNLQQFSTNSSNIEPPPFIRFPSDIFQEIKQRFPFINDSPTKSWTKTTTTPTPTPTLRTKQIVTESPSTIPTTIYTTPKTPTTTTPTTLRTRYTVRPNRNRGQSKWQEYNKKVNVLKNQYLKLNQQNINKTDANAQGYRKRPNAAAIIGNLGVKMNSDINSFRVESSTSSSSSISSRPTKIVIETIPSSANSNRNYYNTSSTTSIQTNAYNHIGYEQQSHNNHNHNQEQHYQQQPQPYQGQQQTITLQNQQQNSDLSAQQPEQGSYETYFSVYDDDIDLYRDIEYQQQQQQQQHQQQSQEQPPVQQYQSVRQPQHQQQQHSTYRPLEILTTPTPAQQVPLRETSYNNKQLQQTKIPVPVEKPIYTNQQALIYNSDYDEDLIAQIEQDNAYEQPTRSPTRAEQITIRTLNSADRSSASTTRPELLYNDARNYYRTLTTQAPTTTPVPKVVLPTSYLYETSNEYVDSNEQLTNIFATERSFYEKPTKRPTTLDPKLVFTQEADEYSVIDDSTADSKETTKAIDFTTIFLRPTTASKWTTPSRFSSSSSTSYTRPSTHNVATTNRRTIPSTAVQTTTPKSTTQFVRTTTAASTTSTKKTTTTATTTTSKSTTTTTSTTQSPRSKTHANKSYKNRSQKSRTKNPTATTTTTTTTTSTTITTPIKSTDSDTITNHKHLQKSTTQKIETYQNHASNINTLASVASPVRDTQTTPKVESLISVVAQTQSHSKRVDVTVAPVRFNIQSLEEVEAISDESQNVQVKATEEQKSSKFIDKNNRFAYLEESPAYESSPRGNSVRVNADKPYRGSVYYDEYTSRNSDEYAIKSSEETLSKFREQQKKRLQSFVLSDVEPRSFSPPSTTQRSTTPIQQNYEKSKDSTSSTTTIRYLTSGVGDPPHPFRYSLETGSNGFSLRVQNNPVEEEVDSIETVKPIYERRATTTPVYSTPTTTSTTTEALVQTSTSSKPLETTEEKELVYFEPLYDDIKPTTYAPPLRNWRYALKSSTEKQENDENVSTPSFAATTEQETRSYSRMAPVRQPTLANFASSTERSVPVFNARPSLFKDNLIKTTGSPAQRFVSPFKSLETILQETGRTTSKPRYTSPVTISASNYLQTTSKPKGTYFLITSPPRNFSSSILSASISGTARNFSISDTILSTFSTITARPPTSFSTSKPPRPTTTTTTTTQATPASAATMIVTVPLRFPSTTTSTTPRTQSSSTEDLSSSENARSRGRSRYTLAPANNNLFDTDEPTTYSPKLHNFGVSSSSSPGRTYRRKAQRARIISLQRQRNEFPAKTRQKIHTHKSANEDGNNKSAYFENKSKNANRKPIENETADNGPRAEALVALPLDSKQDNSIESPRITESPDSDRSTEQLVAVTDRPLKYLYSNKYRQQTSEHTLAQSLQNAGYISSSTGRSTKYFPSSVLEQLQLFLTGDSDESSAQHFVNDFSQPEIKAAVEEIKNLYTTSTTTSTTVAPPTTTTTTTLRTTTTGTPPPTLPFIPTNLTSITTPSPSTLSNRQTTQSTSTSQFLPKLPNKLYSTTTLLTIPNPSPTPPTTNSAATAVGVPFGRSTSNGVAKTPPPTPVRASRVNNAIKSSIAAAASAASSAAASAGRGNKISALSSQNGATGAVKCSDTTSNAKCNEIPSRTNSNTRNRGSSHYANQDRDTPTPVNSNRGTHPPRTRPTLKPSGTIVSKAQEFVDIYRYPPSRPEPLYPQPTADKAAAKCRRDVCLLPDCSCGGRDIPADMPVESVPQIVLLTFDDSVNDLNKQLYIDLFEKGRVNPNGCPITATFYVSHEWTDYSQVQNLYADGHEMASHTISHSFGEQFSQKKWTREIAGQREILAAYGGVKLSDVRGMRAPFLSVGGNKMYKMLYDSNFTYDSSMPVYENRPPSWPYTLDYKIFHDCMIPPCPTRSYPGVWQVPMVMWQDLNGGRCSMGDACSNPSDADSVTKMIMKNFERHYTTNRAPFGLFYHAAWFTQPHHKEGFIKFLDAINAMPDVWIVTNWQMLQWVRDPTPISRMNSFQPFQCDYSDRPKRCNNPKVCNLWHKSGVRYMKTCQPCPDIYPWTGKTGIRSSRIDNDIDDSTT